MAKARRKAPGSSWSSHKPNRNPIDIHRKSLEAYGNPQKIPRNPSRIQALCVVPPGPTSSPRRFSAPSVRSRVALTASSWPSGSFCSSGCRWTSWKSCPMRPGEVTLRGKLCYGKWFIYSWFTMIYHDLPMKMVIFHSYVSLPEGIMRKMRMFLDGFCLGT